MGRFGVLYASSQRVGCFVETLACYRLDDVLLGQLGEIAGPDDYVPLGSVPPEWLATRAVGSAEAKGEFADICNSAWVATVSRHAEFRGVDTSALQSPRRLLTPAISGLVYRDKGKYGGIRYPSRFGHDLENWAIYDRVAVMGSEAAISPDDPDLVGALELHRLKLS